MHFAALILAAALSVTPRWLELALKDPDAIPKAGEVRWSQRLPGFETAEMDVSMGEEWVDVVYLMRIDPKRFRFRVMHDPVAPKTIDAWRKESGAVAVINGSFYTLDLQPETAIRLDGRRKGPARYRSSHGAFVAEPGANILDLKGKDLDAALGPFAQAIASYPLLFDATGAIRAQGRSTWLASRSFVAVDRQGRVLLGTSETGFFSLRRLARFLKGAPLDLVSALNLDGGPPACQAIAAGGFERVIRGRWELNDSTGEEVLYWGAEELQWPLPLVLAVLPR